MFFCILLREEYFSGRVKHHGISHTVLLIANSSKRLSTSAKRGPEKINGA
jgi:hypothetical protein